MKKILLWSGALLLIAYFVIYWILQTRREAGREDICQSVEVVIDTEAGREVIIKAEDVLSEIKKMGIKLKGEPMHSIDLAALEDTLRQNPIFHRAEVYRSPHGGSLKIKIEQKDPFFRVETDGASYYVSRKRSIIPTNTSFHAYVPLFTGRISREMATSSLYDLVRYLEENEYYRGYFGHGYYSPEEGLVLTPRIGSAAIYFGHSSHKWVSMLDKLRTYEELVISKKGWDRIEYIKLYIDPQVIIKEYDTKAAS